MCIRDRYGGIKVICKKAGLVPYREWKYFDGMYDLLLELKSYLDEYHNSDYTIFPIVSKMDIQGYERLKSLIQYYGGRKYVASRFGMEHSSSAGRKQQQQQQWGKFDLEFAIDLLEFVRNEQMKKNPPLKYPVIPMPSQRKLLLGSGGGGGDRSSSIAGKEEEEEEENNEKGRLLDEKIIEYGGYENVARRLGLAF